MDDSFGQYDDETLIGYIIETLEQEPQERETLLKICALIKRIPSTN